MRRHVIVPRTDWQARVTSQGLTFHSVGEQPYWDESVYWEFTAAEVDRLEAATVELQSMCVEAGDRMLREGWLKRMYIPTEAARAIETAWAEEPPSLYGRMDLAYDGNAIKLLEYNGDTPTSLLEASVIQWKWLEERFPNRDQWNSLHERLVATWKELRPQLREPVYFSHDGGDEDELTVAYLRDTARQAGLLTLGLAIREIGWEDDKQCFVDLEDQAIGTLFKLYPWEWLLRERFGEFALQSMAFAQPRSERTQWIEPIWKMLWANKALLAALWEFFPGHELLLPAYLDGPRTMQRYVRKPLFGREGVNVSIVDGAASAATEGRFTDGPWVYQGIAPVPCVQGNWVVLGSWLVGGEPAGLGVRESKNRIVRNADRFVPHLF